MLVSDIYGRKTNLFICFPALRMELASHRKNVRRARDHSFTATSGHIDLNNLKWSEESSSKISAEIVTIQQGSLLRHTKGEGKVENGIASERVKWKMA